MNEQVRVLPHAPRGVTGRITVPSSKSLTQRALLAAARAGEGARVVAPLDAEDPRRLHAALELSGFVLPWTAGEIAAAGWGPVAEVALDLGNNGTGLRLLLAQLTTLPGSFRVDGWPRLRERPVAPLVAALRRLGGQLRSETSGDRLPLWVEGRSLPGGRVDLDAAASSQFVSALLMLAPLLPAGLAVRVPALPPSRPYIDLTVHVLRAFGIGVESDPDGRGWRVEARPFRPVTYTVEGDWSAAAFPLVAAALAGGEVEVLGLSHPSAQGDACILEFLESAGCEVATTVAGIRLQGRAVRPIVADLRDCPDLFPALAVAVAWLGGRLSGLGALPHKESDRLGEMVRLLGALGLSLERQGDVVVGGGRRPAAPAGPLDPAGDHRLAMALAVAAVVVPGVRIVGSACVAKSWPGFWSAWEGLLAPP